MDAFDVQFKTQPKNSIPWTDIKPQPKNRSLGAQTRHVNQGAENPKKTCSSPMPPRGPIAPNRDLVPSRPTGGRPIGRALWEVGGSRVFWPSVRLRKIKKQERDYLNIYV
eukprot:8447754-Pyramimonas_sp.AAC.1